MGGRRAGSRYHKASFSLVRTQGQIGKGDMAPSLTPLLHPADDIHTLTGRRNLPLALEVHSSLQPLLMLCGWRARLEMTAHLKVLYSSPEHFPSRIRAWWPLHIESKLLDWFRNRSLNSTLLWTFPKSHSVPPTQVLRTNSATYEMHFYLEAWVSEERAPVLFLIQNLTFPSVQLNTTKHNFSA